MNSASTEVIVVGGGHAGLTISYLLNKYNLNHIVFEKSKIGNTWRNQRWDSFRLNTPNKVNILPGQEMNVDIDYDGFCSAPDLVTSLEVYAAKYQLPVIENSEVLSIEKEPESNDFSVCVLEGGFRRYYRGKQIVIASGAQNLKQIPSFSDNVSKDVKQLHSSEYKNSASLPDGAVLVIGGAQSGVQVAEDLIDNGKKVFLSTSRVGRTPRRYRDKDIVDWLILTGFFDMQTNALSDPGISAMKFPQISGVGLRGHTVSLQYLAMKGVINLGKAFAADSSKIYLQPDVLDNIKFADESSKKIKVLIDDYIQKLNIAALSGEEDPADIPDDKLTCGTSVGSLNLKENGITTIIWATGFSSDFNYLRIPGLFSHNGTLLQSGGVSDIEGLYFLGLPWQRKRKSGIILGISEDAEFIMEKLLGVNKRTLSKNTN